MADKKLATLVIQSSHAGWLKQVAAAYKSKQPFVLQDDANIGLDPRKDTLLQMGQKAKLSGREWSGVLISAGVAGIGAWLLVMAVLDPEPFSKVTVALASGAVLLGTGGLMAVRILTQVKPPNIRVSKSGTFEVYWD